MNLKFARMLLQHVTYSNNVMPAPRSEPWDGPSATSSMARALATRSSSSPAGPPLWATATKLAFVLGHVPEEPPLLLMSEGPFLYVPQPLERHTFEPPEFSPSREVIPLTNSIKDRGLGVLQYFPLDDLIEDLHALTSG